MSASNPTIYDVWAALGGDPEVSEPTIQQLLDATEALAEAGPHEHAGADITSGTVADARVAATIARDAEIDAAVAALALPGAELDYAQITSAVSPTATSEATANVVVTGNPVTYDGSTPVMIEFVADQARPSSAGAGRDLQIFLYDGSSSIGFLGYMNVPATGAMPVPICCRRRLTPSAGEHTYSVRAAVSAGTGLISAGAGGAGAEQPAYLRITRA